MEEPDVPWEMDEYWAEETKDRSMVSWMFHKGLVIGKKMLVTGMIISSAPVVVPPLIVMTAIGFAVSVPYGIILASHTFSEKLLDMLLPGTSPPFSLEEEGYSAACKEVEEDDYRLIRGFYMEEDEGKITDERTEDLNEWTEMIQVSEEPGGEVIMRYQETVRYSPITAQPAAMRIEEVVLTAEAIDHDPHNSEIVEVEVRDVILVGNSSGKGDNLGGVLVEEPKDLITGLGAKGNAGDSVSSNDKKLEHGVKGKIEIPSRKKSKRKGRKEEKVDKRELTKASDETTEIKSGSVQPVTAGTVDHLSQAKDDDKVKTSEEVPVHSLIESTSPKTEMNSARTVIFPSLKEMMVEGKDAEEAIWQRIEAVRQIVGYKDLRQATCLEELRALYLFTGVEPPVSLKDASNLAEVNKKLQFLLSVVGVM